MFRTVVAVAIAVIAYPACTTNVVIVEQVVTTSGDQTTGFESTSPSELEDTSTSDDSTSTSTTDDDSTSTSTSTGALDSTSTTTDDESTSTTDDTSTGAETTETIDETSTGTTGPTPECGDGIVSDDEECDDGNQIDDDSCSNACLAATCGDGVQNQGESDIDCGGEWCITCSPGETCVVDDDCFSQDCELGVCQAPTLVFGCEPAVVDAVTIWNTVVLPQCSCHSGGSGELLIKDAATLKSNTIGVHSPWADMPRVTPGNVDESYLLFKILGQQNNVPGGGGASMPLAGTLTDDQKCALINWVKSGAN